MARFYRAMHNMTHAQVQITVISDHNTYSVIMRFFFENYFFCGNSRYYQHQNSKHPENYLKHNTSRYFFRFMHSYTSLS